MPWTTCDSSPKRPDGTAPGHRRVPRWFVDVGLMLRFFLAVTAGRPLNLYAPP
ncbi:hypothetical protein [Streptosporangium canum]|uniref:hypothetical protein n=1 Tax=Streptosporangium canum TaxID=324952 RepID=UPI00341F5492